MATNFLTIFNFRFSTYGASENRRDRMLRHYNTIGQVSGDSYKDRKAKRGNLVVTDAEIQAAMPKTRLQLREHLVEKG